MIRSARALRAVLLLVGALAGCGVPEERTLVVASTTSTEDSGLFDVLLPAFERAHPGWRVRVLAVGSGQALELGRRRDADVLLVHAPAAEAAFVAQGHGLERRPVMYNDFILLGPASDPAGIRGQTTAAAALRCIAEAGASFISRGDDSGTHRRERTLWGVAFPAPADARPGPSAPWYLEAGQGMGEVLRMASEKRAYTLADRATYLFLRALTLEVMVEGDTALLNPYGVIPVRGAAAPEGARLFADWITSPAGQEVIGRHGVDRFGRPLFQPGAPPR